MAHVHFFLNPKGGTGKSLFSYITAQYLISLGADVTCIDCDPITPTLIEYKALNPNRLDIMEGTNIEKTKFDRFVELIVAGSEDQHFIIDNGTSSFVALADYLTANGIVPFLNSMHHTVTFHVVIVGGDNLVGSLGGFQYITKNFKNDAMILVWLNPFFGPVQKDGKTFDQFSIVLENPPFAQINYPDFPKDMFGKSFARLQKDRLTFAEVCDAERAPEGYDLMTCHRLNMMRDQIFKMLEASKAF